MLRKIFTSLSLLLASSCALATIQTKNLDYSVNGTVMEGFVAYDDSNTAPRPGILIVPDWMGMGKFPQDKAITLAKQGYVAFVADIYGKNARPHNTDEAAKLASQYVSFHGMNNKGNYPLLRQHIRAAYDTLTGMKEVDPKQIVVMGYCMGGTTALELARSGVPLVGTVSFHGGLTTPTPEDAKNIKGSVLILHGADDPHVTPDDVKAFKEQMKKAGIDFKFVAYKGAVHGFTNPAAGTDNSKGIAYNAQADKASWEEFENFLKKVFHK